MLSLYSPPHRPVTDSEPVSGARPTAFYRHDLDGLRGIAIALVAMFHVWFGRVSGGVDVFLALSGFFFGGKILRAALNPAVSLSPVAEVSRLVRRLVPALVVVLAGCAALTILVQPQTRWEAFADQSLASLGYYQNWELANTVSDYLKAGEAVSPLQHIWSMSVQGQFYVGFLLLIAGCAYAFRRRLGAHLRTVFIVAARRRHGGLVRLCDRRPPGQPVDGLLQHLRPGVGAAAGRTRRGAGALPALADVAAHDARHHRAGDHRVLRRPDRRRPGIPGPLDAGARRAPPC